MLAAKTWRSSRSVEDCKGGIGSDAAVVVPLRHEDITIVAPVGRPRVLHQNIALIILGQGRPGEMQRRVYIDT